MPSQRIACWPRCSAPMDWHVDYTQCCRRVVNVLSQTCSKMSSAREEASRSCVGGYGTKPSPWQHLALRTTDSGGWNKSHMHAAR